MGTVGRTKLQTGKEDIVREVSRFAVLSKYWETKIKDDENGGTVTRVSTASTGVVDKPEVNRTF